MVLEIFVDCVLWRLWRERVTGKLYVLIACLEFILSFLVVYAVYIYFFYMRHVKGTNAVAFMSDIFLFRCFFSIWPLHLFWLIERVFGRLS